MPRAWNYFPRDHARQLIKKHGMASREGIRMGGGRAGGWVTAQRAYRAGKKFQAGKNRRYNYKRGSRIPAGGRGFLRTGGFYRNASGSCGGEQELKFFDLDINDASIAIAGTIAEDSCLTIAQGDGEQERDGRKMCVKKLGWKFRINVPAIAGANIVTGDTVRVMLYLDTQTNGAAATAALILASDDFQSFNNLEQGKRFRTLMDRTYDLNINAAAGDGAANDTAPYVISDSFYKDMNLPVTYDSSATTGAIATMRDNNIGVLLLSKTGNLAEFESKMRIRFTG